MNGAIYIDITTIFHCVGIRDPNNSHDSCGVEFTKSVDAMPDNSRHSVNGIRERNDTSGVRSTESVNATTVRTGVRSTESVYTPDKNKTL
jgi:hypothetical protein